MTATVASMNNENFLTIPILRAWLSVTAKVHHTTQDWSSAFFDLRLIPKACSDATHTASG